MIIMPAISYLNTSVVFLRNPISYNTAQFYYALSSAEALNSLLRSAVEPKEYGSCKKQHPVLSVAIVLKEVENHGGYAWAESSPREGATFNVLLPVG